MSSRRLALSLILALALACGPGQEDGGRVLLLGLDGLDPETVDLLMSEGKLPNFAKLRQEGAYGRLTSQKPLLSPIIWTTIATGKGPELHGIGHFVSTESGSGKEIPTSSQQRRVKALWNIASDADKSVATVGWWATWPPEVIKGSVVSDHTAYHFLFEDGLVPEAAAAGDASESRTYPPELLARLTPQLRRPADLGAEDLAPFVTVSADELASPFDFSDELAHFRWALATAMSYRDIGLRLWREDKPDLELVYIEGIDSTSHLFGHLFRAQGLGGELEIQQRKFGDAVEQMYLFADRLLGEFLDAMDERTTLVVLSDHGFELGKLHDDPSKTRDLRRVSERFHRLQGILYLYGHRVKGHARIDSASILDITPTVLALLGQPPARDMPGRVLQEALTVDLGMDRVASYEFTADEVAGAGIRAADADVSQAQLEHLRSLGYLGGKGDGEESAAGISLKAERNLAAINFQAGRYREAAEIYRRLIDQDPADTALHTSLAGVLGALERYDEALVMLNRAIELDPLNVEAYHNRAVIRERRNDVEGAVADYRTALRYQPQFEPSRRALTRLVGSADVRLPTSATEQEAAQWVDQASLAARQGNYGEALRLLELAEKTAPTFVLTYQYRANVAYLMGDVPSAVRALEKALELEPDNALFRANLERLQAPPDDR